MENFTAYNPVKIHFGKDVTDRLGDAISEYGSRVLLMYGKGSIQKNGIYEKVVKQLQSVGAEVTAYSGLKPNPVVSDVLEAAQIGKLNKINVIVAVGGGSVIDSAKITSLSISNNTDPWAIMKRKVKPKSAIPIITVLTLAAAGSEMNPYAVLQNNDTDEKIDFASSLIFPKHSFLNPEFTYSVPNDYTAYGIVDVMAHAMETYFGAGKASLSDRFVEAIVKEMIEYGPLVLKNPHNYEYRANIMWAATTALNGTTEYGRRSGDWGVHEIGHNISYLFDTPHGATLSIAYIAWLELQKNRIPERIAHLGNQVFGVKSAKETIQKLKQFFQSINSPVSLLELDIEKSKQKEIEEQMIKNKVNGMVHKLSDEDRCRIVDLMMQ